jgi:hypothetical protein
VKCPTHFFRWGLKLGNAGAWNTFRNVSSLRQLPRTYVPFALLTMFGPLLIMLVQGDAIHPSAPGLAFVALLLLALARRALLAWILLLAWNLFFAFAVAGASGWTFPSAPLFLLLGLISAGLLLSPSMRQHVGIRRPRAARPHQAARG